MFVFEQESVCSAGGQTRARCRAQEKSPDRERESRESLRCEMLRWGESIGAMYYSERAS